MILRDTNSENPVIGDCVMCDTHFGKSLVVISRDTHLENPAVGDCVMMCDTHFGKS